MAKSFIIVVYSGWHTTNIFIDKNLTFLLFLVNNDTVVLFRRRQSIDVPGILYFVRRRQNIDVPGILYFVRRRQNIDVLVFPYFVFNLSEYSTKLKRMEHLVVLSKLL